MVDAKETAFFVDTQPRTSSAVTSSVSPQITPRSLNSPPGLEGHSLVQVVGQPSMRLASSISTLPPVASAFENRQRDVMNVVQYVAAFPDLAWCVLTPLLTDKQVGLLKAVTNIFVRPK